MEIKNISVYIFSEDLCPLVRYDVRRPAKRPKGRFASSEDDHTRYFVRYAFYDE